MAEKRIVGVKYSDEVNADLYMDSETNQLTKAVNNVNGQTIPSGGGDFKTATVTIIVDALNTTTVNATLFNVLTAEYGQIGEASTINEENNTKTIVIYQNKPIYLDDGDEIVESVSGAIEKDPDNSVYWISGDCSITFKKFSII